MTKLSYFFFKVKNCLIHNRKENQRQAQCIISNKVKALT